MIGKRWFWIIGLDERPSKTGQSSEEQNMREVARLAGLEPTTSASAGLRSIQLSYKRLILVPKERFELSHPCEYYALNVARLPFRHFGAL